MLVIVSACTIGLTASTALAGAGSHQKRPAHPRRHHHHHKSPGANGHGSTNDSAGTSHGGGSHGGGHPGDGHPSGTTPTGTTPGDPGGSSDASLGGTITSISGTKIVVQTEHHAITLDVGGASVYAAGDPPAPESASSLKVGDRLSVKLSVTEDVAQSDAAAGTPIPAAQVYDGGPAPAPGDSTGTTTTTTPTTTTTTTAPPTPTHGPQIRGTVTNVSGSLVTIASGNAASYTLDLTGVSVEHNDAATDVSVVNVGDTLYARLAVGSDVAAADATAGTPIPTLYAYDFAPGTAPTG